MIRLGKTALWSVLLLTGLAMAGCSYTPARLEVEPPLVIEDGEHRAHDEDFCPPGQAKKGRC